MQDWMLGLLMIFVYFACWLGFVFWARRSKKWSMIKAVGGGFLVGGLAMGIMTTFIPATPVQLTREEKIEQLFSSYDGSHHGLERLIKNRMNDPDSYKHVETVYSDMGDYLVVETTFRGKNAFGAVVKNSIKAKVNLDGEILEISN